jgi:hypothetical protein
VQGSPFGTEASPLLKKPEQAQAVAQA